MENKTCEKFRGKKEENDMILKYLHKLSDELSILQNATLFLIGYITGENIFKNQDELKQESPR